VLKISGLPFPLNILNGGRLIFSPNSLTENIRIDISIPDFAELRNDSTVSFTERILNGISFKVYVDDVLVSPYEFNEPVGLELPYKESLMANLGLEPEDLWIFFYDDSTGFTDNGITYIDVDSSGSKIYGEIAHFSDLVIASQESGSMDVEQDGIIPADYLLFQNYPNPFNPETRIRFYIPGAGSQVVRLSVYNMLGQEVRTLLSGPVEPGEHRVVWDGLDQQGRPLGSGVYLYRLQGKEFRLTRRMLLLR
jgi:hypothetical protein